jgi:hypothetical protein
MRHADTSAISRQIAHAEVTATCVQVFSPSRMLRFKGLPGLAMEAAKTIEGYAKLILPMLPRDIEDMAPGEGFVGQKGLHKV